MSSSSSSTDPYASKQVNMIQKIPQASYIIAISTAVKQLEPN